MTKSDRKRLETALALYLTTVAACKASAAEAEPDGVGWDQVEDLAGRAAAGDLPAADLAVIRSALAYAWRNARWLEREGDMAAYRRMIEDLATKYGPHAAPGRPKVSTAPGR